MNRTDKIQNSKMSLASEAAQKLKRYQQRDDSAKKSEEVERTRANLTRESKRNESEKIVAATERIVRGKDDSKVKPPSLKIEKIGTPVARLHEITAVNEPKGFGTGFLITRNILMTNHHVFEQAGEAEDCVANFKFEFELETEQFNNGIVFKLRPDLFFLNNKELDFALVYVEEKSLNSDVSLSSLGFLPLIETKGKVMCGSHINIIQYPQGGYKKYTTEDNEVFDIDDENGIIYYYTDTEPGSSGSPGFNDFWEVSALHYTGVPATNDAGQWLTKKGEVWDKDSMSENEVDWKANAGKSISRIVSYLKSVQTSPQNQQYLQSILSHSADPLNAPPASAPNASESGKSPAILQNQNNEAMSKYNFIFYGTVNFSINEGLSQSQNKISKTDSIDKLIAEAATEKKERFDENYSNRKGYDETFIPGFKVPVPTVIKARDKELYKNLGASAPYIVPYHHYSLVMNKKRRFVMWTASNVDYNPKYRDDRKREDFGNGAWRLDPRIPAKYQVQADEFYDPATLVDKGHIVRRDDNCWAFLKGGKSDSIGIEYANADTFHWTNCTPQHEAFNRDTAQYTGIGKWGVLENAIKQQLEFPENDTDNDNKDYGQRACVLAGPVLSDDDPEYMDIQYPLKFWKVFAIHSESEGNLVYGFILSQEDKIDETGLEKEGKPRFNKMVKAMQASLKSIENLTGVIFDETLHDFDVMQGQGDANESLRDDLENFRGSRRTAAVNHYNGADR